jgi:CBS domain-containing protein
MSAPNSLITATVDHLARFAPFNQMEHEAVSWMAERLKLGYFAKGETVISPETGLVDTFYIIKQGIIHGEQDVVRAQDDAAWLELREGESFPLGALLSKRPVNSVYKAGVDTFCYELAIDDFHALLRKSGAFHDFCTRRLANLLEQSKQVIQAQYTKSSSDQQSMTSPLAAIIRREPVTCTPDTPMRQVLETMNGLGIGSMVAVDQNKRPLGIFTLHDVLSRVTLPALDLNTPFSAVMSPDPVTLPPQALAYEAALVMARHGFRHILVTEGGKLVGLLSEKDLFTLQRVGLRQLSGVIRKAADVDTLDPRRRGYPAAGPQHAGAGGDGGAVDADHFDL